MMHEMKLFEEPFEKIKSGLKDIEVRLFDDKRKKIEIGDYIKFIQLPDLNVEFVVQVTGISLFSTFKELFSNFDSSRFGHDSLSVEEQISKIRKIYSEEEEKKFGVVGIHLNFFDTF